MLTSSLFSALSAALPPGTPLYLGRQHLGEHDVPPRLVLVPTADTYGGAERAAVGPGRVLWTRQAGYDLILWGRDIDEAEGMLGETLTALRHVASVPVQLQGGSWSDETWLTLGLAYTLRLTVAAPILEAERFATLQGIAQECGGFIA